MKILVYPHELIIGGSQINAIDLAAEAVAAGHEVIVYGQDGPLVPYIEEKGLPHITARPSPYRPSPARVAQLAGIAHRVKPDLIHVYEWPSSLDAYFGAGVFGRTPMLCTVLDMKVSRFVPDSMPLIMGTMALADEARRLHKGPVWCIEPPIDAERDHPAIDGTGFRARLGVAAGEILIVSVSRLSVDLKLDALVRLIDAVDALSERHRLRLALVGNGNAEESLLARANTVNARHGRIVVSLPGPEFDPRPAYAAADIVAAMGSSALRAMAIGRPVVVQGENGFSEIFSPESTGLFLQQGFFGRPEAPLPVARLAGQIEKLLQDERKRDALGAFGRQTVVERFSLRRAAALHEEIYHTVASLPFSAPAGEVVLSAVRALRLEIRNHTPSQKKQDRLLQQTLLHAAREHSWP